LGSLESFDKPPKSLWIHSHICAAKYDQIKANNLAQTIELTVFLSFMTPFQDRKSFAAVVFFRFVFAGHFFA
jgi:hypothetical protein